MTESKDYVRNSRHFESYQSPQTKQLQQVVAKSERLSMVFQTTHRKLSRHKSNLALNVIPSNDVTRISKRVDAGRMHIHETNPNSKIELSHRKTHNKVTSFFVVSWKIILGFFTQEL